jgi:hypothetical protein
MVQARVNPAGGKSRHKGVNPSTLFSRIKWGKFTAMFEAYRRRHPYTRVKDLKQFADLILTHPQRFDARARKRAQFYKNIIQRNKP